MRHPKVSVIIPYNRDRGYLKDAVKSVELQDYLGEIEIIYSQSDRGVSYNFNRGVEKSTGDLIRYLCDDDLLPPDSIRLTVENWPKRALWTHGNSIHFFENGTEKEVITDKRPTIRQMLEWNRINGGTQTYHRSIFEKFGGYDESLWTGEEYDFHLMLFSHGVIPGYIDHFLYLYRRWHGQKSLGVSWYNHEYMRARVHFIEQIKNRYR